MNYHTPEVYKTGSPLPTFMIFNNQLVSPEKLFTKEEYPKFPSDMVKIIGQNGQRVLIPFHRLENVSSMDL